MSMFKAAVATSIDKPMSVGQSKDDWMQAAMELFLRTNPNLDGFESNIEIIDADEAAMEGHGQILARRGDVIIRVPFFVNEGKLQPLDVFYLEDEVYPMSDERLDELFFNTGDEFGMIAPDGGGGPSAPHMGPGGYSRVPSNSEVRSYDKVSAASKLLDNTIKTASPQAIMDCVTRGSNAQVESLVRIKREDIFNKMAEAVDRDPSKDNGQMCAVSVKMAAPGYYHVDEYVVYPDQPYPYAGNRAKLIGQDAPEFFNKLAQAGALDVVDRDGWVILPVETKEVMVDEAPDSGLGKIASGEATVWRSDGKALPGVVSSVHEYNGSPSDLHMFIGVEQHAVGKDFFGEPAKTASTGDILASVDVHKSRRNNIRFPKTAAWVWQDDEGAYHATRPFKVSQQMKDGDRRKVAAIDTLGRRVNFEHADVARICPVSQEKLANNHEKSHGGNYYVPRSYRLIAVGDPIDTMSDRQVTAALHSHQEPADTQIIRSGSSYHVKNEKVAESHPMPEQDLRIFLAAYGATKEAQDSILEKLDKESRAGVRGMEWPITSDKTKVARDKTKVAQALAVIRDQRPIYWKIASDLSEKMANEMGQDMADMSPFMTDTALSLDIAEEHQIDDFVDQVPVIEEAIKTCAELLIQTRLGHIEMVAEEVRDAMMSMEKVAQALRGLDAE